MQLRKYSNLFVGVFFLAFTIVYALQISKIKITSVSLIDSAFYPKIIAVALLVLSALQIVAGIRTLRQDTGGQAEESRSDYRGVVMTLAMALIYVALLEPLGFLISSVLYIFFQIIAMCPKDEIKPVKFAVISVVASAAIYFLFRNGLSLMLPAGPLAGLI